MSSQVLSFTLFFTLISNKFSQDWQAAWNPSGGRMRPAGRGLDSTDLMGTIGWPCYKLHVRSYFWIWTQN